MNLIDYTTNWIKGELFEARLIVAFGILTITAGFLFWKIGTTPNAKALLIPLLVVGTIYSAIGGGMLYSNPKRMIELPQKYERDKIEFTKSEKKRVDDFQYGYKVSKIVATIFFTLTLIIFWTTKNPIWMGIGIALTYFALAGLVIDYFSQERAAIYYSQILKEIEK
ncbi:hypothetical protein E2P86_10885 [Sphingobacterium psychroaquaticum]|uniref:hypothetical protein n=1 Tax=Sphingobacterium psychroaquaticum TaxID=561061 RepID=UPI00106A4B38|nr:hypothetical protein [Sphingobacterium psychroaquaticum]QBQ41624.1 hypothetical protein E2P86_10885 [Sphingobacterium psychroaquaticum]